jgi:hypothetical protein
MLMAEVVEEEALRFKDRKRRNKRGIENSIDKFGSLESKLKVYWGLSIPVRISSASIFIPAFFSRDI